VQEETDICIHLAALKDLGQPAIYQCAQCIAMGDRWVHLRMCMECGNVACCDSSKNKHASAHFNATLHPVMRSIEPGDRWLWCFMDGDTTEL